MRLDVVCCPIIRSPAVPGSQAETMLRGDVNKATIWLLLTQRQKQRRKKKGRKISRELSNTITHDLSGHALLWL